MEQNLTSGAFDANQPIVLASGSPRRKEMLEALGIEFEIVPSPAPEPDPLPQENPDEYACRASLAKAEAVAALHPHAVVIGSDTIVVLDDEIMGKPEDAGDAMLMLTKLVGNTHRVVSGCAVCMAGAEPVVFSVSTDVTMGPQPLETLMAYVATGEPLDKAGAYAIQGKGGFLVESIKGSYNNVVGLPLFKLVETLSSLRALRPKG